MADSKSTSKRTQWVWPVQWRNNPLFAADNEKGHSVLLNDPRFAAHRILDRLSVLAWEISNNQARNDEFSQSLSQILESAPWLLAIAQRTQRNVKAVRGSDKNHAGGEATEMNDGLIDGGGIAVLLTVACVTAGTLGAAVVIGLLVVAVSNELLMLRARKSGDEGQQSDLKLLADAFYSSLVPRQQVAMKADMQDLGSSRIFSDELSHVMTLKDLPSHYHLLLSCAQELQQLILDYAEPPPSDPMGSVFWTTGIQSITVTNPCWRLGPRSTMTINGQGFGATPPPGVGVMIDAWDPEKGETVRIQVGASTWSDIQITLPLPPDVVSGTMTFANVDWIQSYDAWVDRENERVWKILKSSACAGTSPPPNLVIRQHWFQNLTITAPEAAYKAGRAQVAVKINYAVGAPLLWRPGSFLLKPGDVFSLSWQAVNSTNVTLSATGGAAAILLAAGQSVPVQLAQNGQIWLTVPNNPQPHADILAFVFEASNDCNRPGESSVVQVNGVLIGPALGPMRLNVMQSLPGGDFSLVSIAGQETITGPRETIPLIADKRSVVRIDWWPAFPQVPVGEELVARASVSVGFWTFQSTLFPSANTSGSQDPTLELRSGQPFWSLNDYDFWVAGGNDPQMFNIVLPAELCRASLTLTASVEARSPGTGAGGDDIRWSAAATVTVQFHPRRSVRIKYRPFSEPARGLSAPTLQDCEIAIRREISMLPIPDPYIAMIPGGTVVQDFNLGQEMIDYRTGTHGPYDSTWRDEIWLLVGSSPGGGVAYLPPAAPYNAWCAAASVDVTNLAHEICHLFNQAHLNLPPFGPPGGEDPATFPDFGRVVPGGWDLYNNEAKRGKVDLMTYWPTDMRWMSPERWKRVFLEVGP